MENKSGPGPYTKFYTSQVMRDFLKSWGVRHRLSSTYFTHANTRAELGVKAIKRLRRNDTGPGTWG